MGNQESIPNNSYTIKKKIIKQKKENQRKKE